MKIALVNHNLGSGGAEKLIHDMALEMKKKGEEVSVILLTSKNGVYDNSLIEKGVEVIHLSDEWDIYAPKNIFRLVKILKNYDVVHTHTYSSQLWTAFTTYFLSKKIKFVTTEHSTTNNRRGQWYFRILDKWMYSRYYKIVSITEATHQNLKKWLNSKQKNKFFIIENGIKLENYFNCERKQQTEIFEQISNDDLVITMVARFSEQKDHITVIRALKNLEKNIKLILVGEGNSNLVKNEVKNLELENRVIFLGFRKDVPSILKSSNLSILSSHYEGFGLVAAESMATGTPTIASDVPGMREVVQNGGVLFEKGNVKDLVAKINLLLNDKNYYSEVSKKGIEKSKNYSLKKMVNKYLDIYKN